MARCRLTSKAREGLHHILEQVDARFGAPIAERVLDRLVDAFELLAANPNAGHRREDLTHDDRIRFWSVGPTLFAYRTGALDCIEILFIERGERDWERILEEPGP